MDVEAYLVAQLARVHWEEDRIRRMLADLRGGKNIEDGRHGIHGRYITKLRATGNGRSEGLDSDSRESGMGNGHANEDGDDSGAVV